VHKAAQEKQKEQQKTAIHTKKSYKVIEQVIHQMLDNLMLDERHLMFINN